MRVLVTGGSGFVGSHVVDRLLASGYGVRILDERPSLWHRDVEGVETVIGDVCRTADVRRALRGCAAVCHLAAAADVADVERRPHETTEVNAMGTLAVLEAARAEGIDRVLYASTVWVYSDAPQDEVDERSPLFPPAHLYTAGKLSGEFFCRSYAALYGLAPTVLRFGIPYGPRARPTAVVASFLARALSGQPLVIAGSGEQERTFVYVEDLAEGVVLALAHAAPGRTYNLTGHETVTIRGLAEVVREVAGNVEIAHAPARAADLRGARVAAHRAERELGWRPVTPLREGVARTAAWMREQHAPDAVAPRRRARPQPRVERPSAALARLADVAREPLPAGLVALIAVLSCLLPLWQAADGPEQASRVSTVGLAAIMPLAALTFARWPAELRRVQAALCAGLAATLIAVLGFAGVDHVAGLGHWHPVWLLAISSAISALAAVGPPARPSRS